MYLVEGSFSVSQKHTLVFPALKKLCVDPNMCNNYRPISKVPLFLKPLNALYPPGSSLPWAIRPFPFPPVKDFGPVTQRKHFCSQCFLTFVQLLQPFETHGPLGKFCLGSRTTKDVESQGGPWGRNTFSIYPVQNFKWPFLQKNSIYPPKFAYNPFYSQFSVCLSSDLNEQNIKIKFSSSRISEWSFFSKLLKKVLSSDWNEKKSKNSQPCSWTTRQMAAYHWWSVDHRLRTAELLTG